MSQFTAKTPAELPAMDEMLSLSGFDFMRGILEGHLSGPPIAGLLNYRLSEVDKGRVVFLGTPEFAVLNPLSTVHGGWYGTLLDSCMACAVMTMLPKGMVYTTLEYKINITRSIPVGMEIAATGVVQHSGRSTGVASGEIRGVEDGKLYATGSTTCMIFAPKG